MSREKFYNLERVVKGAANHRRIEILFLLVRSKELSTNELVANLETNYQTVSHHARKLVAAGLANSFHRGNDVIYRLSPHGQSIIKFLKTL